MHEITYLDFQTLIAEQSDNTYRIVNNNPDNPDYFPIISRVCNLQYLKKAKITFAIDNIAKPNKIEITILEGDNETTEVLNIIYK